MPPKNSTKQLDEVEEISPFRTLEQMSNVELVERIKFLEHLDGMVGLFFANNRKLNELANSLNSFELDLVDGGKSFENFLKLQKEYKDMMETQKWLKNELGLNEEDIKQEKMRFIPPLELVNQKPQ